MVLNKKRISIIGAGGTAKAIAYSLMNETISHLTLINRDVKKAHFLSENLLKHYSCDITVLPLEDLSSDSSSLQFLKDSDLVINTTPIGMDPHITESPISDFSWVKKGHLCYDVIYKPSLTYFLMNAEKHGATIMNGSGMLAAQGLLAFTLFTDHDCDYDTMKKELI